MESRNSKYLLHKDLSTLFQILFLLAVRNIIHWNEASLLSRSPFSSRHYEHIGSLSLFFFLSNHYLSCWWFVSMCSEIKWKGKEMEPWDQDASLRVHNWYSESFAAQHATLPCIRRHEIASGCLVAAGPQMKSWLQRLTGGHRLALVLIGYCHLTVWSFHKPSSISSSEN